MNMMSRADECGMQDALQHRLTALNHTRLEPCLPAEASRGDAAAHQALLEEEWHFLETARARVMPLAARAPADPAGFLLWFEALVLDGPGQGDRLFPWLASEATLPQMRWFLAQEVAGEAGFDDLTALTMLRMPVRPKLELARNSGMRWDAAIRAACTARCWTTSPPTSVWTRTRRPPSGSLWRSPTPWPVWPPGAAPRTRPSARWAW
jgi:hypothetical protein